MLHFARPFHVVALCFSLCLFAFGQCSAADVIYGQTAVEWPGAAPDAGSLLTISGPGGLYLKQERPAGTWARFSLTDEQGSLRPDGIYRWELMVQAGWEAAGQVQSGWFQIRDGRVVAEGTSAEQPVVVEENAPRNSVYVDRKAASG